MINQSESISELATALSKAQAQMGSAIKDSENPFFKSKYADLTSVIAAVRKPFADNGLSFVQLPVSQDGCVGVATRIMHSSGEWLESEFLIPCKQDAHGYAAGITYCRRLSLQAAAGVPTDDDDGNSAIERADVSDDWVAKIDKSSSMEALQSNFSQAYAESKGNNAAIAKITSRKDAKKRELLK
jgi:hypothetical protein